MINKKNKGQVSIEILILIAILIVIAIVVTVVLINSFNKNIDQADDVTSQKDEIVDNFLTDLNNYNSSQGTGNITPPEPDPFDAWIVSPANNSQHIKDINVSFIANYENNSGQVTCSWEINGPEESSLSGCNTFKTFSNIGDYTANLTVINGSDDIITSVDFKITNNNPLTSVSITSPVNNASFEKGTMISFTASKTPPGSPIEDCNWTYQKLASGFGNPGAITTFYNSNCNLSGINLNTNLMDTGEYKITFNAIGVSNGAFKSDSIDINIVNPFTAILESPTLNSEHRAPITVNFKIDYDNNITQVTCNWILNNNNFDPPTIIQFSGCDTVYNFVINQVGNYTGIVTVNHNGSQSALNFEFRIVN